MGRRSRDEQHTVRRDDKLLAFGYRYQSYIPLIRVQQANLPIADVHLSVGDVAEFYPVAFAASRVADFVEDNRRARNRCRLKHRLRRGNGTGGANPRVGDILRGRRSRTPIRTVRAIFCRGELIVIGCIGFPGRIIINFTIHRDDGFDILIVQRAALAAAVLPRHIPNETIPSEPSIAHLIDDIVAVHFRTDDKIAFNKLQFPTPKGDRASCPREVHVVEFNPLARSLRCGGGIEPPHDFTDDHGACLYPRTFWREEFKSAAVAEKYF